MNREDVIEIIKQDTYPAFLPYIRQGFTEKQADNFIKIALENQSS